MNTVAIGEPLIVSIEVSDDSISAALADGRTVSVPLAWSWRLSDATAKQRKNFQIVGSGEGVHWPDIDEDISARGMLQGTPARPPRRPQDKNKAARVASSNHGKRTQ